MWRRIAATARREYSGRGVGLAAFLLPEKYLSPEYLA